jgi:hypothetical protein
MHVRNNIFSLTKCGFALRDTVTPITVTSVKIRFLTRTGHEMSSLKTSGLNLNHKTFDVFYVNHMKHKNRIHGKRKFYVLQYMTHTFATDLEWL